MLSKKIVFTNLVIVTILYAYFTYHGYSVDDDSRGIGYVYLCLGTLILDVILLIVLAVGTYSNVKPIDKRSYLWSIFFSILSFILVPVIFGVLLSVI
ncbi:hypothetical protein ACFSJU_17440 [Paradesertivirga mongoliensis]|uniref:Uncharacterized protein n=1 Tax=Paradesertivirga mongoliensis TaxID=2100740 RepID=A0ABW4ZRS7_9SPHI|nr:hypothetical protein [Pedobacter mongoliensis]